MRHSQEVVLKVIAFSLLEFVVLVFVTASEPIIAVAVGLAVVVSGRTLYLRQPDSGRRTFQLAYCEYGIILATVSFVVTVVVFAAQAGIRTGVPADLVPRVAAYQGGATVALAIVSVRIAGLMIDQMVFKGWKTKKDCKL